MTRRVSYEEWTLPAEGLREQRPGSGKNPRNVFEKQGDDGNITQGGEGRGRRAGEAGGGDGGERREGGSRG